jgi:DNA (cytosine-5)-methyltransferase 1
VVRWAEEAKPDVIILENVEEFVTWGPLYEDGRPIVELRGHTFEQWTKRLKAAGYKVQWKELRACDYGAPTIRKRFFMIARRDGKRIVWPKPTHGRADHPDVIAGRLLPWRAAADIIDWSLPCPSIFETSEEIMAKYGLRSVRPLADATMKRIARGVVRYVLEAGKPFVVRFQSGATGHPIDEPLATVTANSYIKRPGGAAPLGVVAPVLVETAHGEISPKGVKRWGTGIKHADEPMGTGTINGNHALAAVHLSRFTQNGVGSAADDPVDTVMAGAPKFGLVSAFLAQHNTGVVGHDARKPLSTITTGGDRGVSQQSVVTAHMMRQFGTSIGHELDQPTHTDTATVNKSALISGFLTKYYGTGDGADVIDPLHTDTVKDRFGLVTVEIDGETYAIADIGMRMLTPRERFRAQGFPDSYIIDRRPDGSKLSVTVQGSCCGNSVCPPLAEALVAANCTDLAVRQEERVA